MELCISNKEEKKSRRKLHDKIKLEICDKTCKIKKETLRCRTQHMKRNHRSNAKKHLQKIEI